MAAPDWKILELHRDRRRVVGEAELAARAACLASVLDGLGLVAGERLCYLCYNGITVFDVAQACALLGLYPVPVNHHFKSDEIRYVLEDSGARALIAGSEFASVAAEASAGLSTLEDRRLLVGGRHDGFADYDAALEAASPWCEPPRPAPGVVIYTSGTTGHPKGVMRDASYQSGRAYLAALLRDRFKVGPAPVHLVTGPLYHSAPNAFASLSLALGGRLVVMPRFDAEATLAAIEEFAVTHVHLVPTMMHRMLALPPEVRARYDLSSIRVAHHGAAPCPPATKRAMIAWWGPVVDEYYGSTEAGFVTYIESEQWLAKPGSVGRALDGIEVCIYGEDGQACGPGEVGEIYVRTRFTDGFDYHGDPAKKAGSSRDGAFSNGDVGWLDEDGYLFLGDRKADMIISGGVNIYPAEIEAVIHEHPDVADCAVFGVPDEEWGEAVYAVVELVPGATLDSQALRAHCQASLANYKVPRSVDFAHTLPRQPSGKIYKRKLREPFWAGRAR